MAAEEVIDFDWDDLGEVERGEAVLETLEALFDRLDRHIELTSRQDASNPHVVENLMQGCLGYVDMIYTGRENTCVDSAAFYENSWEVDLEPVPVPLDMWARGAVVSKEKPKLPPANKTGGGSSVISGSSAMSASRKKAPAAITEEPEKSRLSQSSRTPSPKRNVKPGKPKPTKAELDLEDRLREELTMRRRRDEINRKMVETEQKALEDVAELKRTLKGKDYAYDHRGEVVILSKVDGDKLPNMLVKPGTAVTDAPPPETPSEGRTASSQGASGRRSKGSSHGSKRSSMRSSTASDGIAQSSDSEQKGKTGKLFADTLTTPYVEQPNEGQPPPTESIKPSDGVTLTFGRSSKKGAQRKTNGMQDMSKGEYLEYMKKKGHYEKLPFTEAEEFKVKQMQEQKKKERERQERLRRQASMANGEEYDRRASTTSVDSGIGPMGLGVPTLSQPSWIADGVKIDPTPPKPKPKRRGDINKTMILGADDWGQNKTYKKNGENEPNPDSPGARPKGRYPTIEHRERTVGRVSRRPRDRSFGYFTERELQELLPQDH